MLTSFNLKSFILTIIVGYIIIIGILLAVGNNYAAPLFPLLALIAGFIFTGALNGLLSKDITIIEPGLGSVLISIFVFLTLPALELRAFVDMVNSDWLIILMNAIIFTFIGAWLGELIQDGLLGREREKSTHIEWQWVIGGVTVGITVSFLFVNLLVLILGPNPSLFIIPYFLAIFLTGLFIGWMSPGITIIEAGLAGFLTITLNANIARLTLVETIDLTYLIFGIVLGFIVALLGGFIGEKIQSARSK